ncbi:hypothetical protein TKK_0015636 [Trichogramma kaykai]
MSVDFGFTEEERVIAKLHLTHALRLAIDNFEQDHYAVKNADGCDFILMFDYAANWLREQLPGGRFTGKNYRKLFFEERAKMFKMKDEEIRRMSRQSRSFFTDFKSFYEETLSANDYMKNVKYNKYCFY